MGLDGELASIILEMSELGYWMIDMATGAVRASDQFWHMLGYEPGELENTLDNLKKIHHTEDWDKGWDEIAYHIKEKTPYYENELRYLTKKNEWLWCRVRGKIIKWDAEGNPLVFVGYSYSIAEERKYKHQVEKMTLQEAELIQTKNQLEEIAGIIPICSTCKSIRNDEGYWKELESYIETHSNVMFSHGLCESCSEKLYKDKGWFQRYKKRLEEDSK